MYLSQTSRDSHASPTQPEFLLVKKLSNIQVILVILFHFWPRGQTTCARHILNDTVISMPTRSVPFRRLFWHLRSFEVFVHANIISLLVLHDPFIVSFVALLPCARTTHGVRPTQNANEKAIPATVAFVACFWRRWIDGDLISRPTAEQYRQELWDVTRFCIGSVRSVI